ncbi:unnamed protein product [Ixodes pacificus]
MPNTMGCGTVRNIRGKKSLGGSLVKRTGDTTVEAYALSAVNLCAEVFTNAHSVALKCYGLASSSIYQKVRYKVLLLVDVQSVCPAVSAFQSRGSRAECHTVPGKRMQKARI